MNIASPPPAPPVWLTPFLAHCHVRQYDKGVALVRRGEAAETLYYLVEGSVAVLIEDAASQRELLLAYINRGEFIGEMGLFIPQKARSVIIRTRERCRVAEIGYQRLDGLLDHDLKECAKTFLYAIARQLAQRLRQTSRKVGHLAFIDVTGRIAGTLLDLCKQPDAMTHPDGMQIRVTRQELARIVGCSREMAGRVLKNLEEQGAIRMRGRTIVVLGAR